MTIRTAIVEDHDDFRQGMYHMLQATEGFRCVGAFASVEMAVREVKEADVVLMDIGLPGRSGIEGIPLLKKKLPQAHIVMLTVFEDSVHVFEAILAGADGYILKKSPPVRILQAVEEAYGGGLPMTPVIARLTIEHFRGKFGPPEKALRARLTRRELEILNLLVDGLNYAMIGEKLFVSIDTVRNHIRHIYEKLQVHSKAQAVSKALKDRMV